MANTPPQETQQDNGNKQTESTVPSPKKLKPTLDKNQKRFFCGEKELVVWRNTLLYRYSAIHDKSVTLQVTDYDQQDDIVQWPSLRWINDTGKELAKSTIRLFSHSSKRVTITLYFRTRVNAGTLLCQGSDCSHWDIQECEQLKTFVHSFLENGDVSQLQTSLLQTPITFLHSHGNLSLTTPKLDVVCDRSDTDISDLSTSIDLVSCEYTPTNFVVFPPTPPARKTTSEVPTTAHRLLRQKRFRRKTLCFSPQTERSIERYSLKEYKSQVITALNDLEASHQQFKDEVLETIEDNKNATKNELRSIAKSCTDKLLETIAQFESKCKDCETQMESIKKVNQSLKAQLNQCQLDIKNLKSTVDSLTDSKNGQADSKTKSNVRSSSDDSVCCHKGQVEEDIASKQTSHLSHQTSGEVKDKRSPAQLSPMANWSPISDQQQAAEQQDVGELQSADSSPVLVQRSHTDQSLVDNQQEARQSTQTKNQDQTPVMTSSAEDQYQLVNKNQHSPAEEQSQASELALGENLDSYNPRMHSVKRSPSEIMTQQVINQRATHLLVGDSVIRGIDQRRMVPPPDVFQKMCIPGATTLDFQRWLSAQSPAPNIKVIIIHVGVNDCPAGPVFVEDWRKLITLCEKVFPQATVAFSSPIPARGRHNLNNAILPTIRNLQKACDMMGVSFIDNRNDFLAPSGAPRLAMYRDLTHPSSKGTARLAANIKGYLYKWNITNMKASKSQLMDFKSTDSASYRGSSDSNAAHISHFRQRKPASYWDNPSLQVFHMGDQTHPYSREPLHHHGRNQGYYTSESQHPAPGVYDPRVTFDYSHDGRDARYPQLYRDDRYSDTLNRQGQIHDSDCNRYSDNRQGFPDSDSNRYSGTVNRQGFPDSASNRYSDNRQGHPDSDSIRYSDIVNRQGLRDSDSNQSAQFYRNVDQFMYDHGTINGPAKPSFYPVWPTMRNQTPTNWYPPIPPSHASLHHYPLLVTPNKTQQRVG